MTSEADATLVATRCAICGTAGNAVELYAPNFDADDFTAEVFSARRMPDHVHYRMVRCQTCGLVRSDPILSSEALAHLYSKSTFNYGAEVPNLRTTYGRYLRKVRPYIGGGGALLEIGSGNGFMLEEALRLGFEPVQGVEPGESTVAAASPEVRRHIVVDIMRPGLFEPETFNVVCLYQVLDHLPDPVGVLAESLRVLRPGGVVLCFNHNIKALSARLFGEASPIIDIEHTYLYDPKTIRRLLTAAGYEPRAVGAAWNTVSLEHVLRLAPLPGGMKSRLLGSGRTSWWRDLRLLLPLGNLYAIGQRPLA
jgi:SAM-dependent methyltransferase